MKKSLLVILLLVAHASRSQDLYYFPPSTFDPAIPTPEKFLGYRIGSHYTRHDRIIDYLNELDRLSDKITVQTIGRTYEERPLVIATITSAENHKRLEQLRQEHIRLSDPRQPEIDYKSAPVFVHLGYSVHGNETSSGEAALLTAYYLVASVNDETNRFLKEAVVSIDPALNPDGRDRAAAWHNQHKSFPPVTDPLDREHTEAWPAGRTNHFLFDLNRDWLAAAHVETKNRLAYYHQWYPNVVIDFHEMGTNSTYYFEPSKPFGSESAIVPRATYEVLNVRLAKYHAEALNSVGALYWTKEVFDNLSPIYGSTYPDFQGGVGITFEVGSSRGLAQESTQGIITFPFTIRSHVLTGLATVRGAVAERELLLRHQREFFRSAVEEGRKQVNKGYVFGSESNKSITQKFLSLLLLHKLEVHELAASGTYEGKRFEKDYAYVVPAAQPHFRLVHSLFEEVTKFYDSAFYDVTGWAAVHAYGVPFARLKDANLPLGTKVTANKLPTATVENSDANYAFLLNWTEYNAHRALHLLLQKGVFVKTALKAFSIEKEGKSKDFVPGTLVIPVAQQKFSRDSLVSILKEVSAATGVNTIGTSTGLSIRGIDLGSNNIRALRKPEALLVSGPGINPNEFGQLWFLLNQEINFPVTKVDIANLNRVNWSRYTVVILPGGNYGAIDRAVQGRLKLWLDEGGTLISIKTATEWVIKQGLVREKLLTEYKVDSTQTKRFDFISSNEVEGPKSIEGSIYRADLDVTNPVGFGFSDRSIYVFRNGETFLKTSKNPYSTVVKYAANPLVSGYVSKVNQNRIANSASVVISNSGRGRVVLFADDPFFRGYWYGTARLFLNALFFSDLLTVPVPQAAQFEAED